MQPHRMAKAERTKLLVDFGKPFDAILKRIDAGWRPPGVKPLRPHEHWDSDIIRISGIKNKGTHPYVKPLEL